MDAAKAFRMNLPTLDSADAVLDFIACVAQGMLLDVIAGPDGARLLHAAQVANAALAASASNNPPAPPDPHPPGVDSPPLRFLKKCAKAHHRLTANPLTS